LRDAIPLAKQAIDSGAALAKLHAIVAFGAGPGRDSA
jgi:anthranilate phosphoribosyltransferase